ncbi:hypothetical protein [Variovorax saccharolyticus]|uniref:hypothetical protein n=1 Tax=Variovorax saccharolyticus TaxID=3053516 RepID=UPI002576A17D|nr:MULTISPECIES: hypothetical protein [unclassified Variovorax]MDM0019112.1 hypothetical protein [Variovorax sp. J22R187]MDM0026422.1 hypothetical protein [Variovorax sp. J31P216]
MRLLRRIARSQRLTELIGTAEVARAEDYEKKGWVIVRRTSMPAPQQAAGFQTVYAQITDAGRHFLDGTAP